MYYVNKPTKERGVLATMYFSPKQIQEIIKDAGDAGYVLMTFYVGIAQQRNPNMEDSQLSKLTNKPTKTIADTRRKLTKAGWFSRKVTTIGGEKHYMYLVGKDVVSDGFSNMAVTQKPPFTLHE